MIHVMKGHLREKVAGCPLSCRTAGHLICFIQVRIALHTIRFNIGSAAIKRTLMHQKGVLG